VLGILGTLIAAGLLANGARAQGTPYGALHAWVVVECDTRPDEGCLLVRDGLATDSDGGDMKHITLYDSVAECASALSKRSGIKPHGGRWLWLSAKGADGRPWQDWFECRRFNLQVTPH